MQASVGIQGQTCMTCEADLDKNGDCPLCSTRRVTPTLVIHKQGPGRVLYDGRYVRSVFQTIDRIHIGRRDPMNEHWPEIDLIDFFRSGVQLISRRHAEIERRPQQQNKHYLICRTDQETTHLLREGEDPRTLSLDEEVELAEGDRFLIGNEVSFKVSYPTS